MRTTARTALLVACIAVVAALSLSGCVYYNTFYHAKSAYAEAERTRATRPPDSDPSPQEIELLDRVVEKSGRVLRLYPASDWADDALLLMATALYRQGKYESAESRLSEFATLYPDSDLAPDAGYLLAAVMLARDNPVSAEQTLTELAYADPPVELSDDALVMIGRARYSRRRYDEAAEAYASVLERFPGSDLRAEVRFLAAENFVEMGRLEDAAHHLAAAGEERGARRLAFEARIRLAEVYLEIGRLDDALDVLGDLERRTTDRDDLDRVLLLRGRTQETMDEHDEAISTYEGVAVSHARSNAAAEAHYRVGLIRRDEFGTFDEAVEAFREAKDEAPRSNVARDAGDAIRDIEELQESLTIIDLWLAGPEETPAAADSLVAQSDSLMVPQDTQTASLDSLAAQPDSLMALPDTLAIDQLQFVTALDDLPAAPVDSLASDEPDTLVTPEVARAMFRAGEIYLFKMDNAEKAVDYYAMVVEHFGETPLGPKAALAVAWARGEVLGQPMLAAEAYRALLERYPDTDYARDAEKALGIEPVEPRTDVEESDGSADGASAEPTGDVTGGSPSEALEEAAGETWDDPTDDAEEEPAQAGGGEEQP